LASRTTKLSSEDPANVIHTARLSKGRVIKYTAAGVPWQAFSFMPFDKKRSTDRDRTRRADKVHPKLPIGSIGLNRFAVGRTPVALSHPAVCIP
jgi:hypothetical protein